MTARCVWHSRGGQHITLKEELRLLRKQDIAHCRLMLNEGIFNWMLWWKYLTEKKASGFRALHLTDAYRSHIPPTSAHSIHYVSKLQRCECDSS